MRLNVVLVIGVEEVEELPGAMRAGNRRGTIGAALPPVGVTGGGVLLPADGGINRRADALTVEGFNLLAEQVAPAERGMRVTSFRREVAHAMMALGGNRHAVDMGRGQRAGKRFGVELAGHIRNERRGVEIQVDLPLVPTKNVFGRWQHVHKHESGGRGWLSTKENGC